MLFGWPAGRLVLTSYCSTSTGRPPHGNRNQSVNRFTVILLTGLWVNWFAAIWLIGLLLSGLHTPPFCAHAFTHTPPFNSDSLSWNEVPAYTRARRCLVTRVCVRCLPVCVRARAQKYSKDAQDTTRDPKHHPRAVKKLPIKVLGGSWALLGSFLTALG